MTLHTQPRPSESTGLLQPNAQDEGTAPTAVVDGPELSVRARRALTGVFVITAFSTLTRFVSTSSMLDLISSISCAEYYSLHAPSPPNSFDCQINAVPARYAQTMAYVATLNSISACFCSLVIAPYIIRKLGHKTSILIGTIMLALEWGIYVWLSSAAQPNELRHGGKIQPTTALHIYVAQAGVFGIVGVPETLLDMVTQAVVLDTVPVALRSTWLARLQSCASIAVLVSTAIVQCLNLDTSSDLKVDTRPIQIAAGLALLTVFISFFTFGFDTGRSTPVEASIDSSAQAQRVSSSEGEFAKPQSAIVQALSPLRLLFRPIRREGSTHGDWRLSKVLIANLMYGEVAVAGNLILFYCQTRFHTRAKENNLMIGWLSLLSWIYLGYGFAPVARWLRRRTLQTHTRPRATRIYATVEQLHSEGDVEEEQVEAISSIAGERLLTLLSLSTDILAWATFACAGHIGNFPVFVSGIFLLSISNGGASSFTSLSSSLLPDGTTTEELLAALFFFSNVSNAVGPMLNTSVYRAGLEIRVPELVFVFTAALSCVSFGLVASVKTGGALRSV